ncbi:MAG: rhomboid family intramembrane serine protease [bacterium]
MTYGGYQVRFGPGRVMPVVRALLIANAAVFALQLVLNFTRYGWVIIHYFALYPESVVLKFYLWQTVTYMFLHDSSGLWHFGFNMLALWMFGTDVEERMGSSRFMEFYFFCGVGAGVFSVLFPPAWGSYTLGASGAIYGILMAFGIYFPERIILAFMLFPMKARHFVILFGLLELFAMLTSTGGGVAYFAHVGGLAFGYLFVRRQGAASGRLRTRRRVIERRERERTDEDWKRVDEILDKVSTGGMHSLSRREKAFLKEMSRRHRQ